MREEKEKIADFLTEYKLDLPILLNPDSEMLAAYAVQGIPRTIMVNPAGSVEQKWFGPISPETFDDWLGERVGE